MSTQAKQEARTGNIIKRNSMCEGSIPTKVWFEEVDTDNVAKVLANI